MNAKTALLTGIIVGVSLMVLLVGFLAWRENQGPNVPNAPAAPSAPPAASAK